MAAAGLPLPREDHAAAMAELALGMLDALERAERDRAAAVPGPDRDAHRPGRGRHHRPPQVHLRRLGDTVNLAHRLEAQGVPGRNPGLRRDARRLAEHYAFEPRGLVDIRGKGQVPTYLLLGRNPAR